MSDLSITTRQIEGVVVLDLNGDIALGKSSADLSDVLRGLVHEGKKQIVLNLSNVRRIDSSGLGTLVACFTTAEKNEGQLKLSNISERVTELMTMTKLHTVFDIFDNNEAAIQSFEQAPDRVTNPLDGQASGSAAGNTLL